MGVLAENGGTLYRWDGDAIRYLAEQLSTSTGAVTQMLGGLRREGLVTSDGKRGSGTTTVRLTPAGIRRVAGPKGNIGGRSSTANVAFVSGLEVRPPAEPDPEPLAFVKAGDVQLAPWETMWRERIPVGVITVIAGRPGMGKSTLEAAIAAELSAEGRTGIVSNLEDDVEAVVAPRLIAAGADMNRVLLVRPEYAPRLPGELGKLERMVRETGATYVLLDPVAAHFSPPRTLDDRAVLARMMAFCRETRCSFIFVHHTTKSGSHAVDKIGGASGGMTGAARSVYVYGYNPADRDQRALACVKMNGQEPPPTLIIEYETVEVSAGGALVDAGRLRFVEESNATAEEVLERGSTDEDRDADCATWVTLFLAAGGDSLRLMGDVTSEGRKAGFADATLKRAAVELHCERGWVNLDGNRFWYWRLPKGHPLRKKDKGAGS